LTFGRVRFEAPARQRRHEWVGVFVETSRREHTQARASTRPLQSPGSVSVTSARALRARGARPLVQQAGAGVAVGMRRFSTERGRSNGGALRDGSSSICAARSQCEEAEARRSGHLASKRSPRRRENEHVFRATDHAQSARSAFTMARGAALAPRDARRTEPWSC